MLFVFEVLGSKVIDLAMWVFGYSGMAVLLEGSCCLICLGVAILVIVFRLVHLVFGVYTSCDGVR
jgi:hypothetical protein